MARQLPGIENNVAQVQAPKPMVSPQQIAQPYLELANMLDKSGEALAKVGDVLNKDVAVPAAEKAGLQAVTRDDEGNLQVEKPPLVGDAAVAFGRAVKVASLADGEGVAKRDDIALRQQFRDDPDGYTRAATQYAKDKQDQYTKAAGPEVGIALRRAIETQTTQTYKGLLNEHEALTLQRTEKSITAGIISARDDAVALARSGAGPDDPAMQQAFGKIEALTAEKVKNPRLAYPKEQAEYDIQHLQGELSANRFLHGIDETYKNEGAETALKSAEKLLTDPGVKLTEAERYAYFHKATAEVHANEALRRGDLREARKAANDAMFAVSRGVSIEPELQSSIMDQLKASGGQADAARFAASMARSQQLDTFNKMPLDQQTAQIQTFQTAASAKSSYQFFIDKGYRPVEASAIVGHLIQESKLNPGAVHDGGIGFGIAGWNKERLQGLVSFAKERGTSPGDFRTQLEYVHQELQTSEGGALAALKASTTPEQATAAFMHFERPQGYTPQNPTAGHGFGNRLANAKQVMANATGAPTDQRVTFGPGVDLRLAAGMQKAVDVKGKALWDKVSKDMDGGQTPNAQELNSVVDAFRLSNDHEMLEKVASRVDRFEAAKQSGLGPLPQQQAMIAEFERRASQGQLSAGDDAWRKDLVARNKSITEGLEHNPVTTTLQNFPDKFKTPGPLDLGNDQALAVGMAQRGKIAQFAAQNWQTRPVSALDKADLAQVQGALETADPAGKARIFNAIATTLPEDVRNATLKKISDRPELMVSAAASTMMGTAPDVAQSVLRGQQALKVDKKFGPDHKEEDYHSEMEKRLPSSVFPLAGRTDPLGPYAAASGMVKARYADLAAQAGDTSGKLDNSRLQKSIDDVTGGILEHNGSKIFAPARGMPQRQFDGMLWGVQDNDMAGVTTLAGEPVTPGYLRGSARLESIGSGRYLVRLGSDPLKPIYAYRGANTEAPEKFVLDLRGRSANTVRQPPIGGMLPSTN